MGKGCFVQSIKTGSGDHPTTYLLGTLVLSHGYGCWGIKLTTYGYPLLRLKLGIHTSSRIHAFVESRRTTLLLTNILDEVKKDQMGRACCTHGRREEMQTGSWLESMMEKRLRGRPRLGW